MSFVVMHYFKGIHCINFIHLFLCSPTLAKFRVNDEGFSNRYRNRAHLAPHTDTSYPIIYPGGPNTNEDYTRDCNQVNRRLNKKISDYEIRRKVNGDFDHKVLMQTMPALVD